MLWHWFVYAKWWSMMARCETRKLWKISISKPISYDSNEQRNTLYENFIDFAASHWNEFTNVNFTGTFLLPFNLCHHNVQKNSWFIHCPCFYIGIASQINKLWALNKNMLLKCHSKVIKNHDFHVIFFLCVLINTLSNSTQSI